MRAILVMLLLGVFVAGFGCQSPSPSLLPGVERDVDLSGRWVVQLTSPHAFTGTITRVSQNEYALLGMRVFTGSYALAGNRLTVVSPADSRLTEFVWKVSDANHLVLIEAPPVAKTGADYRGATAKRID